MSPELWAGIAACALGIAVVADGLAVFGIRGSWSLVTTVGRIAGAVALVLCLIFDVVPLGEWSPFDLQQMALGLALAMLVVHQLLSWRLKISGAGPVVDLVALILVLVAAIPYWSGAPPLTCTQRAIPYQIHWLLFLLGSGGVLVAGNAGLMLALRAGLGRLGWDLLVPSRADLHSLLTQATFLALVTLGSGLTVGVWWAWRTVGTLTGGDPREGWMAIAWLVSAMGLSAWQLQNWRGRWAASLAIVAAVVVLVALVAVTNPQRLLGM